MGERKEQGVGEGCVGEGGRQGGGGEERGVV